MATRPILTDPSQWATDDLYTAPSEPWDGEPTTIDPSAGRRLVGFEPGQLVPAEHLNYLLRSAGKWATYQDGIEALNWQDPYPLWSANIRVMSIVSTDDGLVWAIGYNTSTNATNVRRSQDGGTTFDADEGAGISGSPVDGFDAATDGSLIVVVSNTTARVCRWSGSAWTSALVTGISAQHAVIYDETAEVWWIGAHNTSGANPRIVELDASATIGSPAVHALAACSYSKPPTILAASETQIMAVAGDAGAGPAEYWVRPSTGLGSWSLVVGPDTCKGLVWYAARGVWIWIGGTGLVYESSDSLTWSEIADTGVPWYHLDTDPGGALAVMGSTLLAVQNPSGSIYRMVASFDGGLTWTVVANPNRGVVTSPILNRVQSVRDGSFATLIGLAASQMSYSRSLRLRL